jgi:hypothetical protein
MSDSVLTLFLLLQQAGKGSKRKGGCSNGSGGHQGQEAVMQRIDK